MTFRVMVSAPYMLPFPEEFRLRLESEGIELFEMIVSERLSEEFLLSVIETFDGVICGDDEFTGSVFKRAKRLKVVSKWGTGIDSIDVGAAAKLGVWVFNTPNAFTDAVADTTLGYILNFARRLYQMDKDIRHGLWVKPDAVSLRECTLGVVGVGNIGKATARRARAFGMNIVGNDLISTSDSFINETGMVMMSLPELLLKSDFVTLHCDLNPTSFHLIGQAELKTMKSSAYLINTARGSVIDEPALVNALQNGRIAGVALDVYEVEPLPLESPLRTMENCLLAPHNSNNSPAARRRVHESTVANLLRGLREAELPRAEAKD
ncbi:MAG: phosphoglycerate dehydrogenase [Pyrinomonadaceae bacterium]|nr:phosphoglycerate dehydrogenase [Pyrinomonadaceae bacterium]